MGARTRKTLRLVMLPLSRVKYLGRQGSDHRAMRREGTGGREGFVCCSLVVILRLNVPWVVGRLVVVVM